MSSTNFVATLGHIAPRFLGRAIGVVYQRHVIEAEIQPRLIFVLIGTPPEPEVYTSDDGLLGCVTQGKKTLAKALVF